MKLRKIYISGEFYYHYSRIFKKGFSKTSSDKDKLISEMIINYSWKRCSFTVDKLAQKCSLSWAFVINPTDAKWQSNCECICRRFRFSRQEFNGYLVSKIRQTVSRILCASNLNKPTPRARLILARREGGWLCEREGCRVQDVVAIEREYSRTNPHLQNCCYRNV